MTGTLRILAQGVCYAAFATVLGYFSSQPTHSHFPKDRAEIRYSFIHGGKPKGDCYTLTREELAKLAPNMRKPRSCPRERVPVVTELVLDGKLLYRASKPPSGLSKDFPSHDYQRFQIVPGRHHLVARLRDSDRAEGYDYIGKVDFEIAEGKIFAVDFKAATGGFIFKQVASRGSMPYRERER